MNIPESFWHVLTVIVAIWAAWTARQQRVVAHEKLRLDLFDRRYAVFSAVKVAVASAWDRGEITPDDLDKYRRDALPAWLLFESDVTSYIEEVRQHLEAYQNRGREIRQRVTIYPDDADPKDLALVQWLKLQPERALDVFRPYLSFEAVRSGTRPWRRSGI